MATPENSADGNPDQSNRGNQLRVRIRPNQQMQSGYNSQQASGEMAYVFLDLSSSPALAEQVATGAKRNAAGQYFLTFTHANNSATIQFNQPTSRPTQPFNNRGSLSFD